MKRFTLAILLAVAAPVAVASPAFAQAAPTAPAQPDLEVRVFFRTGATLREDPITGSFNASLAQWLLDEGHIQAPYLASQGAALGLDGQVRVEQEGATVWIGGQVTACVRGEVWL